MSRPEPQAVVAAVRACATTWTPLATPPVDDDPLRWPGYPERRTAARRRTGATCAVTVEVGTRDDGSRVVLVAWRFGFLGGSMGAAEGAAVVAAYAHATTIGAPVVVLAASGGARMFEGMAALVQMAATVTAARAHADAGLLQVAVCNQPTTGGVNASHVNVADVRLALPRATIGFAGPRVAEAFTGASLPPGSHTAESALAAGLVDAIVPVEDLGVRLDALLAWGTSPPPAGGPNLVTTGRGGAAATPRSGTDHAPGPAPSAAWAEVQRARADDRPRAAAHLECLDVAFVLRGDLAGTDDDSIVVALATLPDGARAVVVAMDVECRSGGRTTSAGFRKAWRGIDLAERLGLPLVTLVDTPGADPSAASEAAGITSHIARTLDRLLDVDTPTVALVIGEGGSGGALALAVADRLLVQEHATFSVIAPEGAASILHRDPDRAEEVTALLDPTAIRLLDLGIADEVVPEPTGAVVATAWDAIARHVADLHASGATDRVARRRAAWQSRARAPWTAR